MINVAEVVVNTPIKAPFVSFNNVTGLSAFSNTFILKDGVNTVLSTTYIEIGGGLYVATFTPTATGLYTYFVEKQVQGIFRVIAKSIYTFAQNLEDAAIGSWSWNKDTGVLTFTRQDSTALAGFAVIDNLTTASRARTTP